MEDITKAQRKTQAEWFVDGIAELVGGAMLAAFGVLLYASTLSAEETFSALAMMAMIVGFPLSAKAVRTVKSRVAHERTGYVKYPERSGRRRGVAVILAVVLGAGIVAYAVTTGNITFEGLPGTIMLAALGVSVTVAFALRAYRLELPRFYITAGVVAITSTVALFAGLGFIAGMGAMWTALGVVSLLTGATVFAEYMTAHPEAEVDPSSC